MKITSLFSRQHPTLSFEVFPPKNGDHYNSVEYAVSQIAKLNPDFMSVTYRAGGSTAEYSVAIATTILNHGVLPLAHLTCVGSTRERITEQLQEMKEKGIENILALRGDIPEGMEHSNSWSYRYAAELIRDIRAYDDFCIGAACYPEGHPESQNQGEDISRLKEKVDAGCDFITTQMFFDNNILYNYIYKIREAGITVPVIAGIMPVTNAKHIKHICELSGTTLPQRFKAIVDRFGDSPKAMMDAGIAYATEQIIDLLANGHNAVHVYSMNKPEVAQRIHGNLARILEN